ncbi:MAG: peptidyl-prolyl cis-trans isomerase [Treponema sp.]|nr:peptidyl-prolyl cis-trans isomerase [Treponema sp.]
MNKDTSKKIETKKPRSKTKSGIAISVGSVIVFVLIFVSFIIVPGMVQSGTQELPVFGKYGRHVVKFEQGSFFNQALSYYGNQIKANGQNYNDYIMELLTRNAYQQAFNETVRRYAFIDAVKASGYTAAEKKIDRKMINEFLDQSGKYSERLYRDTPDATKQTMRKQFEEEELANRFLYDYFAKDVIGNTEGINFALRISDNEIKFMNKMNKTAKAFDAVIFNTEDLPASQAIKFASENPDMFNKYSFKAISVETESIAKKVLSQIKGEEITFDDAIEQFSKNYYTSTDGVLKNKYEYQIISTLNKEDDFVKIADLKEGEYSPVIKTGTGYTIYQCTKAMVPMNEKDADLVEVVSSYLKTNEMGRVQDYFIEQANSFIASAKASSFDKACKEFGKAKKSSDGMILNFENNSLLAVSDADIEELSTAYSNEDFLTKLFALDNNEISEPVVLNKAIVVLKGKNAKISSDEITADSYKTNVTNQDYSSVVANVFASKKLKNNFDATYNKYFTSKK